MKKDNKKGPSIVPLGDKVLVRPQEEEEGGKKLPSGIILPDTGDKEKADRGVVVAVGPGRRNEKGDLIPMGVKEKDKVVFQWGEKVEIDGEEYYVVSETNIIAVIK